MQSSSQISCIHFMRSFLKIFTFVTAGFILSKWLDFDNLLISFEIIAICFQCNHHLKYPVPISWNHSWRSSRSWLQTSFSRNDSISKIYWSRSKSLQSVFNAIIISNILHPFHEIILENLHVRDCRPHPLEMTRFWALVDIVRDLVREHCNLPSMQSPSQIFCIHFMRSFLEIFTFVAANLILSKWLDSEHLLISFEISFENTAICLQCNHHLKYPALISWDHSWRFSRSWLQASFSRNDSISKVYWFRSKSLQSAFNAIIISNILHSFHEIILEDIHTRLLQTSSSRNDSISKAYWFRSRSRSRSLQSAFYSVTISDILHPFHEIILEDFHVRDCMIYSLEMTRFWTLVDIVRDLVREHCNLSSMQSSSQISCTHFMRSFLEIFTFVAADFTLSKWLDFENLLISFEIIAICFQCSHHLGYLAFISWDHFRRYSHSVAADFIISKWLDFGSLLTSFEISFEIIAICFLFSHYLRYPAPISWDHFWKSSRSWLQASSSRNDSISKAYWFRSRSRSKSLQPAFYSVTISDILHPFDEIILGDLHVRGCRPHPLEMIRFWTLVDIVRDLVREHCNLLPIQSLSQVFCTHFMRSF